MKYLASESHKGDLLTKVLDRLKLNAAKALVGIVPATAEHLRRERAGT